MNIDKLKKVIQKANPSILELKLGCEVEINKEKGLILRKYPISPSLSDKQSTYDIWLKDSCNLVENYFSNFKILGRPITLCDVLLATQRILLPESVVPLYSPRKIKFFKENTLKISLNWTKLDNDLDSQSDATKQFLIDVLVKNK